MLIEDLKVALATTVAFKIKAQKFHWNVIGTNFKEYHEFFGELYEQAESTTDLIAEHIRSIGYFAPGSFAEYMELSDIDDDMDMESANSSVMMSKLYEDVETMIDNIEDVYRSAEEEEDWDISDFAAQRLTELKKSSWMLASYLGKQRGE